MIGETLGNYRLVAQLGSGSMGVVYLGEHQRIARRVAIKVLTSELSGNPVSLQRFFNEARATSLIRHPGIVEVFDCDVDAAGHAYIVMEHLEGETLGDRLRRADRRPGGREGQIGWPVACAIAGAVAEAVAAAHDKEIVHRDLKPENVFLVRDPDNPGFVHAIKVLDFGVAKLLSGDGSARLTMRGTPLGTPEYMAPEQCGGLEEVDHRADVYALGCILYQMLSGAPPFVAERVQELITGHMFRPIPPIAERAPDLPPWLAELVTRMLAKDRSERPASMRAVAEALGGRVSGS